jgi:hypothetical protein
MRLFSRSSAQDHYHYVEGAVVVAHQPSLERHDGSLPSQEKQLEASLAQIDQARAMQAFGPTSLALN